jgi:hypothetical protein
MADPTDKQAEAAVVRMRLVGAKAKPEVIGMAPLPGKSHYFIGKDPKRWHTNVAQYAKVMYQAVYPGIDLVYYGNQRQLEYDLVVAPGADPKKIKIAFLGVDKLEIDANGRLVLHTATGDLIQRKPIVYQEINGERKNLEGRYVLQGKQQVGFQVARYDTSRPLIIDPVLAYSTYLGGAGCPPGVCSNDDAGFGIAVDSDGNTYLTGRTLGFPTTEGAYDQVCGSPSGSFGEGGCGHIIPSSDCAPCTMVYNPDAFVAKLNASGTALIYSTYLGGGLPYLGGNPEAGTSIAVDSTGNAYVTGQTRSADFPVTPGALRTTCGCGTYISDAFVTKLNPSGSALVYSTYLAGSSNDIGYGIALDEAGNAYVTGVTSSSDFPAPNAAQAAYGGGNDAFVAKLNAAGTALLYSTFLGGSGDDAGRGIAVRGDGSASLTGTTTSGDFPLASAYQSVFGGRADAFVTTLSAAGSFSSSTYLGGSDNDYGYGIALDSAGDAYVAGSTASTSFPATTGAFTGAFAAKLGASGTSLLYSTNPGGGAGYGIAVNGVGNAFVTGVNGNDAFVSQLTADGSGQVYTFALGGSGIDSGNAIAVDGAGNAYVTGSTTSTDLPTTPGVVQPAYGGGSSDVFVSKIAEASAVRFSAATYSAAEGAGSATITVTRTGDPQGTVSVDYTTSDGAAIAGSDYTAVSGTISFADGDTIPKTFTVTILHDTAEEPNETVALTLGNPGGNAYLHNSAPAVLTIVDDDTWARLQFSAAAYGVSEGSGTVTITVTRSASSVGAISVDYATANGTAIAGFDYTATSGTISFADGDSDPKTLTIPIVNDTAVESSEMLNIMLSNPVGNVYLNSPGAAVLTVVDDDTSLAFSGSTYSAGEGAGLATITVNRVGDSTSAVSVNFATSNGSASADSDYTAVGGTINFASGDTAPKTFTVPILNDTAGEPYETVNLTLSNPTGGATVGAPGTATLTIVDNDASSQPVISAAGGSYVTYNSARITWTTNEASDSQVEYGTTTSYGSNTNLVANMVTSHSMNLSGLSASTVYHYRVKSRNASGQLAISWDATFATNSGPQPTISSTNPNTVTYGVTRGSSVTIYGSNFVVGATITVGRLTGTTVAGSTASATTPFVFTSSSQVKFWWPNTSLAPASYTVQVTNPASADGLSATLPGGFTVNAPQPMVSSVSPASVTYGVTASTALRIDGANFVVGATVTVGSLSGTTVAGSTATASARFVHVSVTRLSVYWPNTALAPGVYTVTVTNPAAAGGLSGSAANVFTVVPPQPSVSSVSPASVVYGVTASSPLTIYGTNFVVGATVTVGSLTGTTVAGTAATWSTGFVHVNSGRLSVYWPNTALAPGVYTVTVMNPAAAGGLSGSTANVFTVVPPQPTVTGPSPNSVTYGVSPGSLVTIYGSNFVVGARITVGSLSGETVAGSAASATTPFVFTSRGQVKFWWPNTSLVPEPYDVQVTNPTAAGGLSASLATGFTVIPPQPTISSTSPTPVTYGDSSRSVTIYGSNFVVGARITVGSLSGETVAGSAASATTPFVFTSNGQVKFWWPSTSLPVGSSDAVVTNSSPAGGLTGSLAGGFVVQ